MTLSEWLAFIESKHRGLFQFQCQKSDADKWLTGLLAGLAEGCAGQEMAKDISEEVVTHACAYEALKKELRAPSQASKEPQGLLWIEMELQAKVRQEWTEQAIAWFSTSMRNVIEAASSNQTARAALTVWRDQTLADLLQSPQKKSRQG